MGFSVIITARIQRMKEGNIFTLSTLAGGGGIPLPANGGGGTRSQVWTGGVTQFPGLDGGRYPIPRSRQGGTPIPGLDGGTLEYPPHPGQVPGQDRGYPGVPPCQDTEQHSEHLLHGGRYASCVHAGGLSCYHLPCEH